MANSYNVSKLPAYVEQHKTDLIAKSVIGFNSAKYLNLITDVKGDTALNLIETNVELGDGSTCGWTEAGSTSLSQRILQPAFVKVNMAICDKTLLNKYAGYLVRVAADKTDRDLPFEKEFVEDVIRNVNAKVENMIWQGSTENDDIINGFGHILNYAGSYNIPEIEKDNVFDAVRECIAKLPDAVKSKNDLVAFMPRSAYDSLMQQLVDKNLYHYNPANGDNEYYFPGTRVKCVAIDGMFGANVRIIVGSASNFYLGVDMLNGQEIFDLWYSKDNREFRLAIEFAIGVQIAYPGEITVATEWGV